MYLPKNKETITIERKPRGKKEAAICSESKSRSRNNNEYHLLLKANKNDLCCSQSSTANTKLSDSSAKKENSATAYRSISKLVMKNSIAKISKKRCNSKEQKNIYHNELFGTKKFSKGNKCKEEKKEEQNDEHVKKIITIHSTFRMFYYHKHFIVNLDRHSNKEEACAKVMNVFFNKKREVLRMLRNYKPIIIDKVLGEKIKYIDWLLRAKCLVEKQKAFDLMKERTIMHKMKIKVQRFSNLVDKAQNKNAILDGNEIIQNLRNNYKKKKLKESSINSDKGTKQKNIRSNKKVTHEKEINFLIKCIIKTYVKNCYKKIHQKSKEVSLQKIIIPIAEKSKKKFLSKALSTIKDNAKLLSFIINNKAYVIQHKFINSFPNIKQKRETLALIKSYKVSQRIFLQSITMIQRWFIHSLNNRRDKTKEKLREIFISHFLYRQFKPVMKTFLLSYHKKTIRE